MNYESYLSLVKRNVKMFFKDKGMFFTSLITPIILLILYATFLAKVYRDSFVSSLAENFTVPDKLIDGTVGAELLSSLLAVSSVTVAFCSNLLTVQDKLSGARKDMLMTPVKKSTLALAYFSASFLTTLIVSLAATAAGFIYLAFTGWYMSFADVLLLILDVIILTAFGTALSSIVNVFITTQGQGQAVGTVVRRVRVYLRRVYADCELRQRLTKHAYVFTWNLRHFAYKKPRAFGRL